MTSDLDTKMKELRSICARIESGKLSLEETLVAYERGVKIGREIDAALTRSEQQIDLIKADGTQAPFPRSPGRSA